jgi:hypothetical protein
VTDEDRLARLEAKVDKVVYVVDQIMATMEDLLATFAPQLRKLKAKSTGMLAKIKERA